MSEDINSEADNEPSKIRHETPSDADVVDDALTAKAKEALAAIDANGKDHIGLMLRLGEVLSKAKRGLKHGEFAKWCGDDLKRSPSWCSAHRRLFEGREDLQLALAWAAATGHRWASCHSVERLLKIVADWKKAARGDSASAPKPRQKDSEIIADLRQQLADADADFVALRDPLPLQVDARVMDLVAAIAANDIATKEELAEIARAYHWRLCDLVEHGTCSAPQVSKPAAEESAYARSGVAKADDSTLADASTPQNDGCLFDSSSSSTASRDAPVDLGVTRFLYEARPQNGDGVHGTKLEKAATNVLLRSGTRANKPVLIKKVEGHSKRVTSSPRSHGGVDEF